MERSVAPSISQSPKQHVNKDTSDAALRAIFLEGDTDRNGHIELSELEALLKLVTATTSVEFTRTDAQRILESFDSDGNGLVEEHEFVKWVQSGLARTQQQRETFAQRSTLAMKLNVFLTAIGCRIQNQNAMTSNSPKSKQKELLKDEGIRTIFREYDTNGNGNLDLSELKNMLQNMLERGGVVISSDISKTDAERILEAFDEDGNGLVEEGEFVRWVSRGLCQTKETRAAFAKRTPLAAKLTRFLTATERVIGRWKRLQRLRQRKGESVVDVGHHVKKRVCCGDSSNKSLHQPMFSALDTDASSTANLCSSIVFDTKNINFGRTVLQTSKKKSIHLVNDTDHQLSVLLSVKSGSGFTVVKPASSCPALEAAGFQKILVGARQQLAIPLRYRPMLLGRANASIIAKCTTINHGKAVFRVVSTLAGICV